MIRTPDQRLRVFVSSTLEELRDERAAARRAIETMRLAPVMFELGARPHPPRALYRSYLEQSDVFVGIYWQRYGWVAPDMEISGLEDELVLSAGKPRLLYLKEPSDPEPSLRSLLDRIRDDGTTSFKRFGDPAELERLVADDLAILLSERFDSIADVSPAWSDVEAATAQVRLPSSVTPFIGRDADVAAVGAMLRDPSVRVVTLTGPGGIGKTRLALEVSARVTGDYDDGVAFVQLASVTDERLVPAAVMEALGLRDPGVADQERALAALLAESRLLLVLDNFEHLIGAASLVSGLLAAAPGVTVLVTSRQALRLQGEHEYHVAPLAVPRPHASLDEVRTSDAAALFERRAAARRPGFRIDETNAEHVAALCRRLEGVPLAIELAAAHANLFSPAVLVERLEGGVATLGGGSRDLPVRHQALRATLDWSYGLLAPEEQRLLAVVAVFNGGFDLDAAEQVCAPDDALVERLAALVDNSMIEVAARDAGPRFRMLAMVRDYAAEKLEDLLDASDVHRRHADVYQRLAIEAGEGVRRGDHERWLHLLAGAAGDGDADNLRAALRWLLTEGRVDDVADTMWAIFPCLWMTGRFDEARWFIDQVLQVAASFAIGDRARARSLTLGAMANLWLGSPGVAFEHLVDAENVATEIGDSEVLSFVGVLQGFVHGVSGDVNGAEAALAASLDQARLTGDRWSEANALNTLGWLYVLHDLQAEHPNVFQDALETSQAIDDPLATSTAEWQLAEHQIAEGELRRAAQLLATSLQTMRDLQVVHLIPYVIDSVGRLAAACDEGRAAAEMLGAAERIRAVTGVPIWGPARERRDRLVRRLQAELGPAFDEAWQHGSAMRGVEAVTAARAFIASLPATDHR